jgi:hypothetical protein
MKAIYLLFVNDFVLKKCSVQKIDSRVAFLTEDKKLALFFG